MKTTKARRQTSIRDEHQVNCIDDSTEESAVQSAHTRKLRERTKWKATALRAEANCIVVLGSCLKPIQSSMSLFCATRLPFLLLFLRLSFLRSYLSSFLSKVNAYFEYLGMCEVFFVPRFFVHFESKSSAIVLTIHRIQRFTVGFIIIVVYISKCKW